MRTPITQAEDAAKVLSGGRPSEPAGTIHVADPHPLNWLYITYNTVEELVRVDTRGNTIPAAMSRYQWADDRTLQITIRENEVFPDGEPLSAASVKRAFDEVMRWQAPHPPGTQFNLDSRAQTRPRSLHPSACAPSLSSVTPRAPVNCGARPADARTGRCASPRPANGKRSPAGSPPTFPARSACKPR